MKFKFIFFLFFLGIFQLHSQENPNYTITEDCGVDITIETTPADCGQSNGSVTITLGSGIQPNIQGGLPAGTYDFSLPGPNGCVITGTYTIGQNSTFRVHNAFSSGCTPNAIVIVELRGGTRPYVEDSGDGVPLFSSFFRFVGLDAGPHTFSFTDANGCTTETTFTVAEELEVANVIEFGCAPNARGYIVLKGGTPPYTEDSGEGIPVFGRAFLFTGLEAGPHTFTFTDALGCSVDGTITIEELTVTAQLAPIGCGNVSATVSGGTPPYQYVGNGNVVSNVGGNNFVIAGLDPGPQTITIRDRNGCTGSDIIVIPPTGINFINLITQNSSCHGDGTVQFTITGGAPPFSTDEIGQFKPGQIFCAQGLSPGEYNYRFRDSNGCPIDVPFTIELDDPNGATCDDFMDIAFNQTFPPSYLPGPITSGISALINISLSADCVPDRLNVYVNGNVVLMLEAGTGLDCDFEIPNDPENEQTSGYFCVSPCDVITLEVEDNICGNEAHDCLFPGTSWDVEVLSCELIDNCDNSDITSFSNNSNNGIEYNRQANLNDKEEEVINSLESVKIFPNPVSNILNITNIDLAFDYQVARILNSTGQLVETKNISGQDQLQIDASAFPRGMYILELANKNGNKIAKRFVKVD